MSVTIDERKEICKTYERQPGDTGCPEVQVAIMSTRIKNISEHLKHHKKDHASRRGLRMLVGRRSKLLRYLAKKDVSRYQQLVASLGLRR